MPSSADWFEVSQESKMLNITRFNPLEDAFDNLFRGLPVWLPNPERHAAAPTQFRMDVTENDKEYQVLADRKSTRLNSSHVAISYAVFCLKKKKKQKNN